jgi:hypothetical protein
MSLLNLCRMTVSGTPGSSGAITLGAAVTGFISADNAGAINGRVYTYNIREGNKREVASGLYTTSGTTLTRNTIRSTNATPTNPETFTSAAIISFVASATDIDEPWYFNPGVATNKPALGVPGAFYPEPMGLNTDVIGQRRWYTPFILRRRTKIIGHNIVTGTTVAASQHALCAIYDWDLANAKPTTNHGILDISLTTTSTAFSGDYGTAFWLEPGYYAYAFLLTQTGTTAILSTEYHFEGVWDFYVASNTFKRGPIYGENSTGLTTLPTPNSAAMVNYANMAAGVAALNGASRVMYLTRFQD